MYIDVAVTHTRRPIVDIVGWPRQSINETSKVEEKQPEREGGSAGVAVADMPEEGRRAGDGGEECQQGKDDGERVDLIGRRINLVHACHGAGGGKMVSRELAVEIQ